jgi:hypothetical protein
VAERKPVESAGDERHTRKLIVGIPRPTGKVFGGVMPVRVMGLAVLIYGFA